MKKTRSVMKFFPRIRQQSDVLRKKKNSSTRLAEFFSKLEGCLLPIDMLLLKAAAIQQSESDVYCLKDAELAMLQAIDLNKDDIQSKIDLAYFYYAIMDCPKDALPLFTSAIELCEFSLEEAICGKSYAISEINGLDAAIDFIKRSPLRTDRIKDILDGFLIEKKDDV